MEIAESSPNRLKTLWEKEKLLVTSNFSFSRSVFKRPVLQTRKNQGLFGKGLKFWYKQQIDIDLTNIFTKFYLAVFFYFSLAVSVEMMSRLGIWKKIGKKSNVLLFQN